jgi:hypothetical protein
VRVSLALQYSLDVPHVLHDPLLHLAGAHMSERIMRCIRIETCLVIATWRKRQSNAIYRRRGGRGRAMPFIGDEEEYARNK